jgi:predicted methyltransferase
MRPALILASFSTLAFATPALLARQASPEIALAAAIAAPTRSAENVARDQYRKPSETLAFFGVKPTHTVVEIWPGGGWYTEILAPYLKANGRLIVAPPTGRGGEAITKKLDADTASYGKVTRANFPTLLSGTGVAPGTADVVVTFRNVHNWKIGSYNPANQDYSVTAFKELYAMLKPGGVLGIEDHRLNESQDSALENKSGYLKVSTVLKLAEQAGFTFAGSSEVNANSKDTKDYPKGIWTLPPRFAEGDTDRARYAAIGESDRMTLKFIKPKK